MSTSDMAFAGSIPAYYDSGLGPIIFEPYAQEVGARLKGTEGAVLEVACGTGRVSRQLRKSLPASTRLVATDLSEGMLAFAQAHSPGKIDWKVADAQQLPFAAGEFEALVCQFGIMFVPDKPLAVQEFRRVLKPSGKAIVLVWDRIETMPVVAENQRLLLEFFPTDPPQFLDVPYSMWDSESTLDLFETAFSRVTIERIEREVPIVNPLAVAEGCILGNPVANQILERDPSAPEKLVQMLLERDLEDAGGEVLSSSHNRIELSRLPKVVISRCRCE